jgi:spore germination protein GerM
VRPKPTWWVTPVALAVVAVMAGACGIPTNAQPSAIAKANVPFHLLSPSTTTTNPVIPPAVAGPETIYLVAPSQHVLPVIRYVQIPATLTQVMEALLEGPTTAESSSGLQSFLTGTKVKVSVSVTGGIATVDFSTDPVQLFGPDQTLAIAQVVFTVTQQPAIAGVLFQIAGQPIGVPTASGAQVPGPVTRASYQALAPLP